jgi:hypothetical protein
MIKSPKLFCCILLVWSFYWTPSPLAAQNPSGLFETDEVLNITLSGNTRDLLNDRGEKSKYYPLVLSYKNKDSSETAITIKAKTRGKFRKDRANCIYPPVLLNFQDSEKASTLFQEQNKLKLVTSCREDKYVIREYLVYKLYNLITPKSFRVRLVHLTFHNTLKDKKTSFYGILLEEEQQMARRNGVNVLKIKRLNGQSTEVETYLKMAVFQYMIGNTDWSVEYMHNIKAIAFDSLTVPSVVPYDFDHAGIVDAPYALPPEQLHLSSTKHRRYRGYCVYEMKYFEKVVATFNYLKPAFYNVYTSCNLLDQKYIASTLKFLNAFYATINNAKILNAEFSYPCTIKARTIVVGGIGAGTTDE